MGRRRERSGSVLWLVPAALWVAVLFYFSGQDGGQSSALSSALAEKLLRHMPFLAVSADTFEFALRKLAHFGIFAVEGFLLRLGMGKVRPARFGNNLISFLIGGGLAALNELHQLASAGRVCSVTDMAIDASGALAGALAAAALENIAWAYAHRRRKRHTRVSEET